ncbi:hypothetical protein AUF78_04840 [archaeon 13_1_20CM_2_51_12]|nr:MAG: hypothetical protein AUF78_04840 [archaeon 13_1_20CM_2_51_12]
MWLMLAVKAVRQNHKASANLLRLLDEFRCMVNVCIAGGIEENVSSLKTTATSILHNYRKATKENPQTRFPYARRLMMNTCYGFKIQNGHLRLPFKPRQYVYVKLNNHTLKVLSGVDVRSITLTPGSVSISYSKETVEIKPEGYLGIDRNLDNSTAASTDHRPFEDSTCQV